MPNYLRINSSTTVSFISCQRRNSSNFQHSEILHKTHALFMQYRIQIRNCHIYSIFHFVVSSARLARNLTSPSKYHTQLQNNSYYYVFVIVGIISIILFVVAYMQLLYLLHLIIQCCCFQNKKKKIIIP